MHLERKIIFNTIRNIRKLNFCTEYFILMITLNSIYELLFNIIIFLIKIYANFCKNPRPRNNNSRC